MAEDWVDAVVSDVFFVSMLPIGRSMLMLLSTIPGGRGEDQCCKSEISTWLPCLASVIFG
jgi:hypothetical protein